MQGNLLSKLSRVWRSNTRAWRRHCDLCSFPEFDNSKNIKHFLFDNHSQHNHSFLFYMQINRMANIFLFPKTQQQQSCWHYQPHYSKNIYFVFSTEMCYFILEKYFEDKSGLSWKLSSDILIVRNMRFFTRKIKTENWNFVKAKMTRKTKTFFFFSMKTIKKPD